MHLCVCLIVLYYLQPVSIARITFPTGKLVLADGSAMLFSGRDQDVTETTASCSASTLTTTTTTTTKTTPPDLCNQIKCVLQCEDECGWSRPRGMCVSSTISVTSQGEIDNLLGDCPSPISTIGNEKKSKTNYLLVSALSVGVLITFGFGILVGKRRTVKRFEQKGYLHFQKNGAYEPHDASRVPFLNENENCNDDRLLVGNDDDQLLGY